MYDEGSTPTFPESGFFPGLRAGQSARLGRISPPLSHSLKPRHIVLARLLQGRDEKLLWRTRACQWLANLRSYINSTPWLSVENRPVPSIHVAVRVCGLHPRSVHRGRASPRSTCSAPRDTLVSKRLSRLSWVHVTT